MLYRGLQLKPEEVEGYVKDETISLTGYTSTSKYLDIAKEFALSELPEGKRAVVYHIKFTGDEGLFYMSDNRFTAFEEDEILVQDGFEYRIDSIEEEKDEWTQKMIVNVVLVYPAK